MRLGLVERGNYRNHEYADLTGYELEVNGFVYNFGQIIEEARRRVLYLWGFECPPELLRTRLHFSEEKFFNRMVKNEHYGIFSRHTGAHVCLGLVSEEETYNLVIHELAHEVHYRQGFYDGADEILQEAVAIMAEEEFAIREFDWNPHFTSQQLLWQLKELPAFGGLSFRQRWDLLIQVRSAQEVSYLINRYLDEADGSQFFARLERSQASTEQVRGLLNALAFASQEYALYNRRLLLTRLSDLIGYQPLSGPQVARLTRALLELRKLDSTNPQDSLTSLLDRVFQVA